MSQYIDFDFLMRMLSIESTSGSERALADFLARELSALGCSVSTFATTDRPGSPASLLARWDQPSIIYCTHLDTVPPYIAPATEHLPDGDTLIRGRGACDAKGQIWAMAAACAELASQGCRDMGLLLLHGEETGSYGAKEMDPRVSAPYLVVGEPTDNCMATASKGTKSFRVTIKGKSCHSGYPQHGHSAVSHFVTLMDRLRSIEWPVDPELGDTTYNVGQLRSDNPQNILSPELTCRIYFRTTFASDALVTATMASLAGANVSIEALGGDQPSRYLTLPGFDTCVVAFGSDAPQLSGFSRKMLCGPGSILVAHTPDEHVLWSQLTKARDQYVRIYRELCSIKQ